MKALSRTAISKLETGQRKHLKAEEARVLAEIFGVTTDFLLSGRPPEAGTHEQRLPHVGAGRGGPDGEPSASESPRLDEVRRAELDQILSWLDHGRGPQALLVVGPPGIGKSVLASQLVREAAKREAGWATSLLDVRQQKPEVRLNVEVLVSRMFELESLAQDDAGADNQAFADGPASLRIAQRISKAGRPMLCVLDSADELTDATSARLRVALDDVYSKVKETGNPKARLALVVASRLDSGWRGVTPEPRLDLLALPEFGTDVIQDELREAAGPERRSEYSARRFAELASLVYGVTAGLPPLLEPCLSWIGDQQWVSLNRLENAAVFESLAGSFVRDTLLAPQSLFPRVLSMSVEQVEAVRAAIGLLVRYRFFTRSHLQHHLDTDGEFKEIVEGAGWGQRDLWTTLSGTALLRRPSEEIWQEFHPAIRRLLFRYYYPSPQQRVTAHRAAQAYVAKWADEQPPKDQVIGRLDGLWHAVAAIRLDQPTDTAALREATLTAAAETGVGLHTSDTYTVSDLSVYAATRIAGDAELLAAVADADGLAAELNDTVLTWTQELGR